MKASRKLKASMDKVNAFIRSLADQDAGRPAFAGMTYHKHITGMNGHKMKVKVEILALSDGLYSVSFTSGNNTNIMTWSWSPDGDGVALSYEEQTGSDKTVDRWNQRAGGLLFHHQLKKQLNRRLDAFEQNLEAFTWQD